MHDFFLGGILELCPCVGWGRALPDRSDRQRAAVDLSRTGAGGADPTGRRSVAARCEPLMMPSFRGTAACPRGDRLVEQLNVRPLYRRKVHTECH